jgi:dienelactone hydrolase
LRETNATGSLPQSLFIRAVQVASEAGAPCAKLRAKRRSNYFGVYQPVAPLLILVGEADDWTPAEPCRKLTEAAQKAGYPVTIKIYPGAHHAFDGSSPVRYLPTRVNVNSPSGRGATTGGDPKAWADSIREVTAFFARYLKKTDNSPPTEPAR